MIWEVFLRCLDALVGRREVASSSNPLVVESTAFHDPVIIRNNNTDHAVPTYEPPSLSVANVLANNSDSGSGNVRLRGSDADIGDECPICLGSPSAIVAKPPCGHWFHPECLLDWLDRSSHRSCPVCQANIGTGIQIEDDHP